MAKKQPPVCEAGPKWLKEVAMVYYTRIGLTQPRKDILAPLTGQDYQAFRTWKRHAGSRKRLSRTFLTGTLT
jgi:hypothetical protein